jgi:hypothetical protein
MNDRNEQKQPILNPTWHFDPDLFDPNLDASTEQALTKSLRPRVSRWFKAAYAEQRECLRKWPDQKYAAWTGWNDFENLSYLLLLTCRDDKASPSTCAVYVGSRSWVLDQRTRIHHFLIEDTKNQPGCKATIIELAANDSDESGDSPKARR